MLFLDNFIEIMNVSFHTKPNDYPHHIILYGTYRSREGVVIKCPRTGEYQYVATSLSSYHVIEYCMNE